MTQQRSTAGLRASTKRRSTEARAKIRKALRDMKKKGLVINPNSVSRYANVARKTIYNNPDLHDQIRAAGNTQRPQSATAPPADIAGESTINVALRDQLRHQKGRYEADIAALKSQNKQLQQELATAHGELHRLRNTHSGS